MLALILALIFFRKAFIIYISLLLYFVFIYIIKALLILFNILDLRISFKWFSWLNMNHFYTLFQIKIEYWRWPLTRKVLLLCKQLMMIYLLLFWEVRIMPEYVLILLESYNIVALKLFKKLFSLELTWNILKQLILLS